MAVVESRKQGKKRKNSPEPEAEPAPFNKVLASLEMLSDEEDGQEAASDDGEVDEFPEIDTGSDSDSASDEGKSEDEDDEDEKDEEDSDSEDSELYIFPKPETVISDITGQPKRVYPPIEPDYDSDSSTEDVGFFSSLWHALTGAFCSGSQPSRKHSNALV